MNTENKPSVLVIKDRGTGKSTQLVYTSAVTQYPIITQHRTSIMHLMDLANELRVVIPIPMTVEDYKARGRIHENHILIDEGYDLIGEALDAYMGTHVVAVTLSDKIKEMDSIRRRV
nr:MAG TPA: GTP-binding protein Rheb G-protein, SIGNALING PROTEIN [Caudoviricetes sp.]